MPLKGARLSPSRLRVKRRPLQWFGGSPIRDEFEDAVDGIAAGQGGGREGQLENRNWKIENETVG
jgi:hypothetical protein